MFGVSEDKLYEKLLKLINFLLLSLFSEAVAQACSVKKVFFRASILIKLQACLQLY